MASRWYCTSGRLSAIAACDQTFLDVTEHQSVKLATSCSVMQD